MDIIIAGAGKAGLTLARQLAAEKHNITLIDEDRAVLDEATEQLDAIEREVRAILQPGDLITYQRQVGSGHIVMYIGDNQYTDCTNPMGTQNSYNYTENHNNIYDFHGGIWIRSLDRSFQREVEGQNTPRNLFHSSCTRFSVSRPLDIVGDPLPQAMIRLNQARGLWCAVENSAPGS